MISIPSLCHSVKGNFIVEVKGMGIVCFLNIGTVSLEQVVEAIFIKFKLEYSGKKLGVDYIRLYAGRGMPRFVIKLRNF